MSIVACCFMVLLPPLPTTIIFAIVLSVRRRQGLPTSRAGEIALIFALYLLSFIASCFFVYFSFLRDMYVM